MPIKVICQHIIQRCHSALSIPLGISIKLRLTFWFHREHCHKNLWFNLTKKAAGCFHPNLAPAPGAALGFDKLGVRPTNRLI